MSYRRIFTGVGLYHRQQLFAVMANDRLYFRVDDASVQPFRQRGMPALKPGVATLPHSHFHQLPDAVLEEAAELLYWMRAAVEASQPPFPASASGVCSPSPEWRYSSAG